MATEEDYVGLLAIIAEIREASGLGAKPMLTELPTAIKTLLSKYAFERDDARRQRDEAQSMVQAWDNVFGTIEAHIMDRANMRDPANPELYLSIIRSDIAGIKRSSDQICAARWADYSRHVARATAAEASVAQLETALDAAIEAIASVPDDALGINSMGDASVPGGLMSWPIKDELLHNLRNVRPTPKLTHLTKREREYLHAVMDWSAPYEISERLFGYSNGNLVKPKLGAMVKNGLVTWSSANNTYRITDKGRTALSQSPDRESGT